MPKPKIPTSRPPVTTRPNVLKVSTEENNNRIDYIKGDAVTVISDAYGKFPGEIVGRMVTFDGIDHWLIKCAVVSVNELIEHAGVLIVPHHNVRPRAVAVIGEK